MGKAIYLWKWLQSPRWLIPKVAQPQIPPSKSQKRAKLVSVCALTQQVWKAGGKKESGGSVASAQLGFFSAFLRLFRYRECGN